MKPRSSQPSTLTPGPTAPSPTIITAYITGALATERARPGYKRIINEITLVEPDIRDRYREIRARLYQGLTALLLERRDEIGHPDPETAARFVIDQLTAMLVARLDPTMAPTELQDHSDQQFLHACVDSASAYLQLDPPATPS